jgi:hypothetical protein
MKKIALISLALLALSCMSGSSCTEEPIKPQLDAGPDVELPPVEKTILRKNIEVTVPYSWEERTTTHTNVQLVMIEPSMRSLTVVSKEPYTGSFDQFVIESMRGLKYSNADLLKSSSVMINETPYVSVESSHDGIGEITLLTVKSGYGYSLSCGGPTDFSENKIVCKQISESLIIK